uniref:Heat shock protein family A (Hsp70) member 12A n=2 Tax=Canis lupus familiaris TaxID=9615 RepID=A0A8P0PHL6_CANLF
MMDSVGMYGLCGCTAKSKMKCDSRWEIPASGPAWTHACSHTPWACFNARMLPL